MAGSYAGGEAVTSARPKALLLRGDAGSPEEQKLAELLTVLGVSCQLVHATDIADLCAHEYNDAAKGFCVLTAASSLAPLLESALSGGSGLPEWMTRADSVYVYGFTGEPGSLSLLRFFTGDPTAKVRYVRGNQVFISVSNDLPAVCGHMSGLQFESRCGEKQPVFDIDVRRESFRSVLNSNHGHLFVSTKCQGAHL